MPPPLRIISGGQTGGDLAGLVVGRRLGLPTGGTAPKGWRTEKGPQPVLAEYGLVEDTSSDWDPRTRKNIQDADATLIFGSIARPGGTRNTAGYMRRRPASPSSSSTQTINIAGHRESRRPGICRAVIQVLELAIHGYS